MTFTYDGSVGTDLERVRLQIGDTDAADALFSDEEIAALMVLEGTDAGVARWSARCCEVIASKFARDFNWTADGTRLELGTRAKAYREMAAGLRAQAAGGFGVVDTVNNDGYQGNRGVGHGDVVTTLNDPIKYPYW